MELSIFDIIDNEVSNDAINEVVTTKLSEKYKIDFQTKMIGNRYGTNDDTVTTFCSPKDCEKLLFTAILNKEQTVLEDDYLLKCICFELEEYIITEFKKYNIDAIVKSEIIGKNTLNEKLNVQEFINKYNSTNFLLTIIVKNAIPEDVLKNIYDNITKQYLNINLKSLIYIIDETKFEECLDFCNSIPEITEAIIRKFKLLDKKIY